MFVGVVLAVAGQETVTIPKARLEELQRKEAELEKLKGDLTKTKGENVQLKKQHEADAAKIVNTPAPAVTHVSPPMNSLPPLTPATTVDAMDLADYYRHDAASAAQRFGKQVFKVQGEIVAFERPPFIRLYKIHFKTAEREMRVICEFQAPEKYRAVIIVKNGTQLMGLLPDHTEVPIAKVGDVIVVEGKCNGLRDSVVKMSRCELIGAAKR